MITVRQTVWAASLLAVGATVASAQAWLPALGSTRPENARFRLLTEK